MTTLIDALQLLKSNCPEASIRLLPGQLDESILVQFDSYERQAARGHTLQRELPDWAWKSPKVLSVTLEEMFTEFLDGMPLQGIPAAIVPSPEAEEATATEAEQERSEWCRRWRRIPDMRGEEIADTDFFTDSEFPFWWKPEPNDVVAYLSGVPAVTNTVCEVQEQAGSVNIHLKNGRVFPLAAVRPVLTGNPERYSCVKEMPRLQYEVRGGLPGQSEGDCLLDVCSSDDAANRWVADFCAKQQGELKHRLFVRPCRQIPGLYGVTASTNGFWNFERPCERVTYSVALQAVMSKHLFWPKLSKWYELFPEKEEVKG